VLAEFHRSIVTAWVQLLLSKSNTLFGRDNISLCIFFIYCLGFTSRVIWRLVSFKKYGSGVAIYACIGDMTGSY
jgi:hypothetical protein